MKTDTKMDNIFDWHNGDNYIAVMAGIVGGFIDYKHGTFIIDINLAADMEAIAKAVACGFAGVAGRYLFLLMRKHIVSLFKKKAK